MADKEATVYIVDVGKSMGQKRHGRDESDLDWAMRYVWDKIASTVETGRKTAMLGVIGLKTDGTRNDSSEDESYEHVSVWQEISQILMPDLRKLRQLIKPSNTDSADAVSAIVIAIQIIIKQCKKLKYRRKIVLITNGLGPLDMDHADEIAKKVTEYEIELVILGVDFDDAEYGFKEEEKSRTKSQNEKLLKALAEDCNGLYGTLAEAIDELDQPRIKRVNPVHTFKGQLRLGDPANFETAMTIDVERYARTHKAMPPSASNFVVRADVAGGPSSTASSDTVAPNGHTPLDSQNEHNFTVVRNARTYQVDDAGEPGKKKDIDREELAKGYEYGRTAVHISESDQNITKLETEAAMEVIGFILKDKYERYMNMSQANIIIASKTSSEAKLALSSFIHALYELDFYAVARVVKKDGSDPVLILLAPNIETQPDYESLIEVQLPFAEDVRSYRFPPLDKVVTVSGKVLTEHRNLPNDKLMIAMSHYVDQLDLSTFDKDEEGQPSDYIAMEDAFSPMIHRLGQAIRWRAIHPTEPIPPTSDIILKYSTQPEELQAQARPALQKLMKAADVKKVPPKVRGRKRNREVDKPLSGLNVDELLHREKRFKISPDNAIPEFKQMLASTEDMDTVRDAASQMTAIIESQIQHSLGDNNYGRVIEGLNVMRSELTELEEPDMYNEIIRNLKTKLLNEKLGGDRREMFYLVRNNRLGLIDKRLSPVSDVTEEEARAFWATK